MKKSIALAALLALFAQLTLAEVTSIVEPQKSDQKLKLSFEVMDGATQTSEFRVTVNPDITLPIQIRSGYDIPYIDQVTSEDRSGVRKEIRRFKEVFNGISLSVTPSITADHKIQIVLTGHKSDVKRISTFTVQKNIVQGPNKAVFVLAEKLVLENDQRISIPLGKNTLNIHAKLEAAGGVNE